MPRKPAIAISLVLFFSLGGAVAFHLARKDRAPTFTEVDRFMHQIPELTGCTFRDHIIEPATVHHPQGWWNLLGIDRQMEVRRDFYSFDNHQHGTSAKISIARSGEKIIRFQVSGSHKGVTVGMKKFIFERYPKLQEDHLMYYEYPHSSRR